MIPPHQALPDARHEKNAPFSEKQRLPFSECTQQSGYGKLFLDDSSARLSGAMPRKAPSSSSAFLYIKEVTMQYAKETQRRPYDTRALQTEVRKIKDGYTLITVLLETNTYQRTFYSIAITLFTEKQPEADARLIEDVTGDRSVAQSLFRLITEGTVTPCTLSDVLEDQLA